MTTYSKVIKRDRNSLLKVDGGYLPVTIGAGFRVATIDGFYSIADKDGNEIGALSLEALSDAKIKTAKDAARRSRRTYVAPDTVALDRRATDTKPQRPAGIALPVFGSWNIVEGQTGEAFLSIGGGAAFIGLFVGGYESTYRHNLNGVNGMTPTGKAERRAMQERGAELKVADAEKALAKALAELAKFKK